MGTVFNHGFKKHEISMIESIIEENVNVIKERWQEYFGQGMFHSAGLCGRTSTEDSVCYIIKNWGQTGKSDPNG